MVYSRSFHYHDARIWCQPYHKLLTLTTFKWIARKYVQIVKNLFHKAKEERKGMFKCLMIYHSTPLSGNLNLPCKYYRVDLLDQSCQCLAQQCTILVLTQNSLEANARMNIYLHMTYTWVSMSCKKFQQTSGGSQLPLHASVLNQEVIR